MKIFIIGSTAYRDRINKHAEDMRKKGHEVLTPILDEAKYDHIINVLIENRRLMRLADEVHMIYDGRSDGTKFDFGMCFAMEKPLRIIYLNDKYLVDGMREYSLTV